MEVKINNSIDISQKTSAGIGGLKVNQYMNNETISQNTKVPYGDRDTKGRFIRGNNANPGGKPKGTLSFKSMLLKELFAIAENDKDGRTYAELFVKKLLIGKALNDGDIQAMKEIIDRWDGKVTDKSRFEFTNNPEGEHDASEETTVDLRADARAVIAIRKRIAELKKQFGVVDEEPVIGGERSEAEGISDKPSVTEVT